MQGLKNIIGPRNFSACCHISEFKVLCKLKYNTRLFNNRFFNNNNSFN